MNPILEVGGRQGGSGRYFESVCILEVGVELTRNLELSSFFPLELGTSNFGGFSDWCNIGK